MNQCSRMPPEIIFGARLKELRTARQWSQCRLGQYVYVSGDLIGKVENAVRRPTADLAARLDEVFTLNGELVRARAAFGAEPTGHETLFGEDDVEPADQDSARGVGSPDGAAV